MSPDAVAALNRTDGGTERRATVENLRTTLRLLEQHPQWSVRHALALATDTVCVCPRCIAQVVPPSARGAHP
jgi:hypothetical protein